MKVYNLVDFNRAEMSELALDDEVVLIRHKIKAWFSAENMLCSVQVSKCVSGRFPIFNVSID